jgi:hypothetical protein
MITLVIYIYIYIYLCVCVCVWCVCLLNYKIIWFNWNMYNTEENSATAIHMALA